jgi:hypothetical protein
MEEIPTPVLSQIFSLVDLKDIASLSVASKKLHTATNSELLWKSIAYRYYMRTNRPHKENFRR